MYFLAFLIMCTGYNLIDADNIDFKMLVKDTTLVNGTKEHGERYLFTLNNSRIFK